MSEARIVSDDRHPRLLLERVSEARGDPPLHGAAALSRVERALTWITQQTGKGVSEDANPLARAGAVANTSFAVAIVTGILLLFWYKPSVYQAYDSLAGLAFVPQLLRSLHRYSSDVAMLFALFHGLQTLGARKVGGARWLAWLSGLLLVGVLWLDGWTGYWLVWDERGRQVALATAALVDLLPIFPDPLSRSFLTDSTVNSLLFFIVFFIHMLIPAGFGLLIWAHILRVNRSRLFTGRTLSIWLGGCLLAMSLMAPAYSVDPAAMAAIPADVPGDWWFLGPLTIIERLGAGPIWLVLGIATVVLFTAPWLAPKRRVEPNVIDAERCNGCTQCYQDCPFNAIVLEETDPTGRESAFYAQINPSRCVGCGICVGSCDSAAIDGPRLPVLDARRFLNGVAKERDGDVATVVAFVCGGSAAGALRVQPDGTSPDLPGYRIIPVMCTGWVHALTVERALRHGAAGALIVSCGHDSPCREGITCTAERMAGQRTPALRLDHVDVSQIRQVSVGSGGVAAVQRAAARFRDDLLGNPTQPDAPSRPAYMRWIAIAIALSVLVWLPSNLPLLRPEQAGSELVVSFKHAGAPITGGELADDSNVLPHMRRPRSVERGRQPVRLRVLVDGELLADETYEPGGLFGDGASIALAEFPVDPGTHSIRIELDDGTEGGPARAFENVLEFEKARRRVVLFDSQHGFTAH